MLAYGDGFHSDSITGVALAVGSASASALFKVSTSGGDLNSSHWHFWISSLKRVLQDCTVIHSVTLSSHCDRLTVMLLIVFAWNLSTNPLQTSRKIVSNWCKCCGFVVVVDGFLSQVLFRKRAGNVQPGAAGVLLSCVGLCSFVLHSWVCVLLYFTHVEYWPPSQHIPWDKLCAMASLLLGNLCFCFPLWIMK